MPFFLSPSPLSLSLGSPTALAFWGQKVASFSFLFFFLTNKLLWEPGRPRSWRQTELGSAPSFSSSQPCGHPDPLLRLLWNWGGEGSDVSGDGLSAVSCRVFLFGEQPGLGAKPGSSPELWDLGQPLSLEPPYFTCKMGR